MREDEILSSYPLPLPILFVLLVLSLIFILLVPMGSLHMPGWWGVGVQAYFSWIVFVGLLFVSFVALFLGSLSSVVYRFVLQAPSLLVFSYLMFIVIQFAVGPMLIFIFLEVYDVSLGLFDVFLGVLLVIGGLALYIYSGRGSRDRFKLFDARASNFERLYLKSGFWLYAQRYYGAKASLLRLKDRGRYYLYFSVCLVATGLSMVALTLYRVFCGVQFPFSYIVWVFLALLALLPGYFFERGSLQWWLGKFRRALNGRLRVVKPVVVRSEEMVKGYELSAVYRLDWRWGGKIIPMLVVFLGLGMVASAFDVHNLILGLESPMAIAGFVIAVIGVVWYMLYTRWVLNMAATIFSGRILYLKPLNLNSFLYMLVSFVAGASSSEWEMVKDDFLRQFFGGMELEEALGFLARYIPLRLSWVTPETVFVGIDVDEVYVKLGVSKFKVLRFLLDVIDEGVVEVSRVQ